MDSPKPVPQRPAHQRNKNCINFDRCDGSHATRRPLSCARAPYEQNKTKTDEKEPLTPAQDSLLHLVVQRLRQEREPLKLGLLGRERVRHAPSPASMQVQLDKSHCMICYPLTLWSCASGYTASITNDPWNCRCGEVVVRDDV